LSARVGSRTYPPYFSGHFPLSRLDSWQPEESVDIVPKHSVFNLHNITLNKLVMPAAEIAIRSLTWLTPHCFMFDLLILENMPAFST
jgi:hypothetical protein